MVSIPATTMAATVWASPMTRGRPRSSVTWWHGTRPPRATRALTCDNLNRLFEFADPRMLTRFERRTRGPRPSIRSSSARHRRGRPMPVRRRASGRAPKDFRSSAGLRGARLVDSTFAAVATIVRAPPRGPGPAPARGRPVSDGADDAAVHAAAAHGTSGGSRGSFR